MTAAVTVAVALVAAAVAAKTLKLAHKDDPVPGELYGGAESALVALPDLDDGVFLPGDHHLVLLDNTSADVNAVLERLVPLEADVHGHVLAVELLADVAAAHVYVLEAGELVGHLGTNVGRNV